MIAGSSALRLAILIAFALGAAACGGSSADDEETPAIGFIFVGERDDLGYNQAAWTGHEAVARAFPSHRVIGVENVPEDDSAIDALEDLIDRGATILFATSFGHLDAAYDVASRHPEVTVLHQGALEPEPALGNFGTYFGTHAEAVYAAGIAAGSQTESGRLGFVVAFPIPATFNNVNAFLLGAREVAPDATIDVVFTDSWCDPDTQREAANTLIARGVDVIAQHQDCTRTILESAEANGIAAVGYHADGSEVAPTAWLTGAIWTWDPLYVDITRTILDGSFASSPYNGDFRGTLADGNNPFAIAETGERVDDATNTRIADALDAFTTGSRSVFTGPLIDVEGNERVPASQTLSIEESDAMDYFLDGVTVLE